MNKKNMLAGVGKNSLILLDEQYNLLHKHFKNKNVIFGFDSCSLDETENSEMKIFQDLVAKGSIMEYPEEKIKRVKKECKENTKNFLKDKYKSKVRF